MNKKTSCLYAALFAGVSLFFIESAGLWTDEERSYDEPVAYVEGATAPVIIPWEMW